VRLKTVISKGVDMPKEHFFEIKIVGKSTTHTEAEIIDDIYEFLKDKAEFKIQ
jgi:hypothetical protein